MSSKGAAAIVEKIDDLKDIEIDLDADIYGGEVMVGGYVSGDMFLVVHECPFCRSQMETIGVGFTKFLCGKCKEMRGREIEMEVRLTKLEMLQ